jgi:hypothetical protein
MQDCTSQIDSGAFQYITTIDNRRVVIADTVTGLAIGFSHFRHPMTQKKFKITGNPGRDEADMTNQRFHAHAWAVLKSRRPDPGRLSVF